MVQAAISLGIDVAILASTSDSSAPRYVYSTTIAKEFDKEHLQHFVDSCDFVTFDHEVIDADILRSIDGYKEKIFPTPDTLELSSRKAKCRRLMAEIGLPTPKFEIATNFDELRTSISNIGLPVIVKSSFGGYDGRGVFEVKDANDLASLKGTLPEIFEVVIEEFIEIEKELSIIVVRDKDANVRSYPLLETLQQRQMCSEVYYPVHVSEQIEAKSREIAEAAANAVASVGVLAVELFLTKSGDVIINELAPRPHNSGHLTIEAMATSQFENHIRAVCSLPIGSVEPLFAAATMVNLVGIADNLDQDEGRRRAIGYEDVHLHLYGKENRDGRKIGHITVTGKDQGATLETSRMARDAFLGTTS